VIRIISGLCTFAALVWGVVSWAKGPPPLHTPPGILAAEEPLQEKCPEHTVGDRSGYTMTAVATYLIHARVLHTKHYFVDGSDLVPDDVALGWGRMSDQSVLDKMEISQGNRFYFYDYPSSPPIPERELISHSSNNHLIAANSAVAHVIANLYPGQIVTMQGYLVNVNNAKGQVWSTSLIRTDTAAGSCEVFYVEGIKAELPGAPKS
jgi:hypothetical protein